MRSLRWAKVCPKHVELILEINKTVIVASRWFPYLPYLHWWRTVKHKSRLVHLVGLMIKKFVTRHLHMNVKCHIIIIIIIIIITIIIIFINTCTNTVRVAWFKASTAVKMRSSLFWDVRQSKLEVGYGRFGTIYRSPRVGPLKLSRNVRNYQYRLRKIPQERRLHGQIIATSWSPEIPKRFYLNRRLWKAYNLALKAISFFFFFNSHSKIIFNVKNWSAASSGSQGKLVCFMYFFYRGLRQFNLNVLFLIYTLRMINWSPQVVTQSQAVVSTFLMSIKIKKL